MPFTSFREFIQRVDQAGDLLKIDGADREADIGALTEIISASSRHPMLLFDKIKGYSQGFRVAAKPLAGVKRMAMALELDPELSHVDMVKGWKERLKTFQPLPPREVKDGPVRENVFGAGEIDLLKFPAPKWHDLDGGYYIGTGSCVFLRDPDGQWVNMGVYRVVVHDGDTLGIFINHIQHGRQILQKYWAQGKNCPVALSFGQDPAVFLAAAQREPWGVEELSVAGWLRGEPVEFFKGEVTGLPIPATAEIVVEGEIPPFDKESRPEGPFGERTGYYATGLRNEPVIKVKSLMHRNDPIIFGEPPLRPVPGMDHFGIPLPAAGVWSALEYAGVQDVKGVWQHGPFATVIAIKQHYEGHARQVAAITLGVRATLAMCRFVIVVDEDIDPANLSDVFWAITSRCDPAVQSEILKDFPTSDINPRVPPEERAQGRFVSSRMIIDACRPFRWLKEFPASNVMSAETKVEMTKKWQNVLKKLER